MISDFETSNSLARIERKLDTMIQSTEATLAKLRQDTEQRQLEAAQTKFPVSDAEQSITVSQVNKPLTMLRRPQPDLKAQLLYISEHLKQSELFNDCPEKIRETVFQFVADLLQATYDWDAGVQHNFCEELLRRYFKVPTNMPWYLELQAGDSLTWNDPNPNSAPRVGTIKTIEFKSDTDICDIACITWEDDSYTECLTSELA